MTARNAAICAYYKAGHKPKDCAKQFGLGRQRVYQILCAAGVMQPYRSTRTKFLGVNVSEGTKDSLKRKAEEAGVSVSQFASDVLDREVFDRDISPEVVK